MKLQIEAEMHQASYDVWAKPLVIDGTLVDPRVLEVWAKLMGARALALKAERDKAIKLPESEK